nr:TPA_asm: coat protein [Erythranthe ophiovirus]
MAGSYTASSLLAIVEKEQKDEAEKRTCSNLFLLVDNRPNQANVVRLRELARDTPNAIIYLNRNNIVCSEDELNNERRAAEILNMANMPTSQGNNTPSPGIFTGAVSPSPFLFGSSSSQSPPRIARPGISGVTIQVPRVRQDYQDRTPMTPDEVVGVIRSKVVHITSDDVRVALETYVSSIPKNDESYNNGEVKVKVFQGVPVSISNVIAAGTAVLDAILYMTYRENTDNNQIFEVSEKPLTEVSSLEITDNLLTAQRAIKGAFCCIYNQGFLPSLGATDKNLSKFVRETIFKNTDLTTKAFCEALSCTDPAKFPAYSFLMVELNHVPTAVASRCKMSIAGNKAVRYAREAAKFEKGTIGATPTDMNAMEAFMERRRKLDLALQIVNFLVSISTNVETQKALHPLNPNRPTIKNFTLKLTCAIIYSLSEDGRVEFRNHIIRKNIEAFRKDVNIFGELGNNQLPVFSVLENQEADFGDLSLAGVRAAYNMIN